MHLQSENESEIREHLRGKDEEKVLVDASDAINAMKRMYDDMLNVPLEFLNRNRLNSVGLKVESMHHAKLVQLRKDFERRPQGEVPW